MVEGLSADTWASLASRLPSMIQNQFAAYRRLVDLKIYEEDGPKELTAWENARKAALSHLQTLIRVHDLVQSRVGSSVKNDGLDLDALLQAVRDDLDPGISGEVSEEDVDEHSRNE